MTENEEFEFRLRAERERAAPRMLAAEPKPPIPEQQFAKDQGRLGALAIGAGRTFDRLGAGIEQSSLEAAKGEGALGKLVQVIPGVGLAAQFLQKMAPRKQIDDRLAGLKATQQGAAEAYAPLKEQYPVMTGIGEAAPAMAVPVGGAGAGLSGLMLRGAVAGAVPEAASYGTLEERAKNAALGGVTGGLGAGLGYGLGQAASKVGQAYAARQAAKQAANAPFDDIVRASQAAGFPVPPSQAGAGPLGKLAESLSGKYKTEQLASIKSQPVANDLARRALGLPADEILTPQITQRVAKEAFDSGYAPVMNAGKLTASPAYTQALDNIGAQYAGAAKSFPNAAKNPVADLVDGLKVGSFDAGDAIGMTRILRENASKAFAQGDKGLGKANRDAAKVIENEIEANLQAQGKSGADMLDAFRAARTQIAKANDVERALDGAGNVNQAYFAKQLQKGKPLTDELKTIGDFARTFPKYAQLEKPGNANPFTIMDFGYGGLGGAVNPALMALPVARVGARYGVLSGPYQRSLGRTYSPGLLGSMGNVDPELISRVGLLSALAAGNAQGQ